MSEWREISQIIPVPERGRVLVFSPIYDENHPMRYRIMDAQFVRASIEATHWKPLEPPK